MTDVNQLITEHLDIWTSAIEKKSRAGRGSGGGLELYGIKKLRELIFELAVRGKLVPQSEEDQSVELLLRAINQERATVLSDPKCVGKWSKPSGFVEPKKSIPPVWKWVALADVLNWHVGGGTPSKTRADYWNGGIPWASVKDVGKSKYLDQTIDDISSKGLANSSSNIVPKGSLLVVTRMGLGKLSINEIDVAINQDIRALSVSSVMNLDYCYLFLKTHKMEGAGLTVKGVKVGQLLSAEFPLPPIEEQDRIVAKVDELMALCDALEQQTEDSLKAHQTLVETCLATLTNSRSHEELTQNWTRIESHFDTLFTTEDSVEALRSTIVQLGVTGRLTRQSTEVVQLDRLLRNIDIERSEITSGRKASKQTASTPQSTDYAFALPKNWGLLRLGQLALHSEAGWSPRCPERPKDGEEWGVLKVSAVTWGKFDGGQNKALPSNLQPRPEIQVRPGDFIISRANTAELVARSAVVPSGVEERLMLSDKLIRFRFSEHVNVAFLNLVNSSTASRDYYREAAGGTSSSMKNVSRSQITNLLVPIPPRDEQDRIVRKVDELFEICNSLMEKFPVSLSASRALADTLTSKIH